MNVIKRERFLIQKSIDNDNIRDALKHSSTMLSEFRTSLLSPKIYYQLYIEIFDYMKHIEWYFKELHQKGKRMKDI